MLWLPRAAVLINRSARTGDLLPAPPLAWRHAAATDRPADRRARALSSSPILRPETETLTRKRGVAFGRRRATHPILIFALARPLGQA